jgi:hypothetical protein
VEGQAAALWRAGGGGVESGGELGAVQWKGGSGSELGGGVLGGDDGVKLGGDVGGGEHRSHFDGLGIAFTFRCWRSYGMGITEVVCKCFIGSSIWVLLLEIV